MGPEALRVAQLQAVLEAQGLEVIDRGNLGGPPNPWQPPVGGYRHLPEVAEWNRLVHEAVLEELAAGRLPMLLGGDHSLAIGSISAAAKHCRDTGRKLRVLWFDAHADFNTHVLTPSGNVHGMPVACLCGHGPAELVSIGGQVPAIDPAQLRQIGIRSVDAGEKRFVHEVGIEVFDMRYIDEMGMRHTLEQALLGVDDDTHVHVSLDVDFLDPDIAPGVGTTVSGRADLPRGAALHGNGGRHGPACLARRRRAQSRFRRPQSHGRGCRGPHRVAVRQEHPDAQVMRASRAGARLPGSAFDAATAG